MLCTRLEAFGPTDIEDYERCFQASAAEISDSFPNSRIAWNAGFNYQKTFIGGLFCLVSDGGAFTSPHLAMPIGHVDGASLQLAVDGLFPCFEKRDWPFRVLYVDEGSLPFFEGLQGYRTQSGCIDCFSDYIYDAESLATLAGKQLHAKRNHVNRFFRACPDFTYATLTPADQEDCLKLVAQWCDEKGIDALDIRGSDYVPIRDLFASMDRLKVRGGVIRIGGEVAAFAMGSAFRSLGVIHFEKARTDIDGLYAVINRLVVENEFADCREINREEDMGIEGLRKAKQSYFPKRMVKKYEVILTRA